MAEKLCSCAVDEKVPLLAIRLEQRRIGCAGRSRKSHLGYVNKGQGEVEIIGSGTVRHERDCVY
jgi:hypothetical protein